MPSPPAQKNEEMSLQHRVRQSSAPSHSRSSETCLKPLRYKSDEMQPRLPCKRKKRKTRERTQTHTHTQSIYKADDDGYGKNREQNRMRNPKERGKKKHKKDEDNKRSNRQKLWKNFHHNTLNFLSLQKEMMRRVL
jgi:hypothetical protein